MAATEKHAFQTLLKLSEPWFIAAMDMDVVGEVLHVRIEHRGATLMPCPQCGARCEVHDHSAERVWRHLDMWQCQTQLHCRLPRVVCPQHGVLQVAVPWALGSSRLSAMFEAHVIKHILACQTILGACRLLRLNWDQVRAVMERAVARGLARRGDDVMPYLAVDEKAFAKGHRYATVLYDLGSGRVIELADERKKSSLNTLYEGLSDAQRTHVKAVCMDMWEPFIKATEAAFGTASVVHDRFHVMKHAGDALNKERAEEAKQLAQSDDDRLKGTRQLWLYAEENLPEKRKGEFARLKDQDLRTAKAWAMKENLRRTWHMPNEAEAKAHVQKWCRWVLRSKLRHMIRFALLVKEKLAPIVRYATHPISNGKAEGINSKIMALSRQARGFRGFNNFRTATLFHCGHLDMRVSA